MSSCIESQNTGSPFAFSNDLACQQSETQCGVSSTMMTDKDHWTRLVIVILVC